MHPVRSLTSSPPLHRLALVDMGSNSVRLVIFDYQAGWPLQLYNEKALCGLGEPVAKTGALGPDAQQEVLRLLQRYFHIAQGLDTQNFMIVATAAMRDAKDSSQFLNLVKREIGVDIEIISGEEEARLSALGVQQAFHKVNGVMGDLGGSSLELVPVSSNQPISHRISLALGPLQLQSLIGKDVRAIKAYATEKLSSIDWLHNVSKGIEFYPVGGAWRSLAKLHMAQTDYPLRLIQGYRLNYQQMIQICQKTYHMSPEQLAAVKGISKRRASTLPQTAAVLEAVLSFLQSKEIVFSTFGLREGFLSDYLQKSNEITSSDTLLSACLSLAQQESRSPTLWQTLFDWTTPLFRHRTDLSDRIRKAICMLSDCGWQENQDYRANGFSRHILQLPLTGISHHERIQIALSLYTRYRGDGKHRASRLADMFLSPDMRQSATALGQLLDLAYHISGGVAPLLTRHKLGYSKRGHLQLTLSTHIPQHILKEIERSLNAVAKTLGVHYHVQHI